MRTTLLALALAGAALPAAAQNCGAHVDFAANLTDEWGESVLERGLSDDGRLLEWWGNPATGTWTLLVVDPSGTACTVNFGRSYETLEPVAPGTDS